MAGPRRRARRGRVGRRPGQRGVEGPSSRIRSAPRGPVLERVEADRGAVRDAVGGLGRRVGLGDADHGRPEPRLERGGPLRERRDAAVGAGAVGRCDQRLLLLLRAEGARRGAAEEARRGRAKGSCR